jgi:ribosomal protein S18 acetylase RimI-like enzyme
VTAPEIRPATPADVPALRDVGVRAWQAAFAGVLPPAEVGSGIAEFFNEYSLGAAVRSGRMLVAERDGSVAGLLEHDRPAPERAVIWKVYVAPEHQRAGVGRALVAAFLAGVDAPEVMVEHDARAGAAGAFFERLGFEAFEAEAGTVRRLRRARPR